MTEGKPFPDTTEENPISQDALATYMSNNPEKVFQVIKVPILVYLAIASGEVSVLTSVLARNGDKIEETTNPAKKGDAIDSRYRIDGGINQYAKKPKKSTSADYTLARGTIEKLREEILTTLEKLEELKNSGELTEEDYSKKLKESLREVYEKYGEYNETYGITAHTISGEIRDAIVAEKEIWIKTAWGSVQRVAKGGLITFIKDKEGNVVEAIGNNNHCDLVIYENGKCGTKPLTEYAALIEQDYIDTFKKDPGKVLKSLFKNLGEEDKIRDEKKKNKNRKKTTKNTKPSTRSTRK